MSAADHPAGTAVPPSVPGEVLVEVHELRVSYGGRGVAHLPELILRRGECVAIVGESGSGKTTSLLAILGLARGAGAQTSGTVQAFDVSMLTAAERELRRIRGSRITLVMQSPQSALCPTARLGTLMRRTLARHGVARRAARTRIDEALSSVRLPAEILRRYPHQISGGQAQRFAIGLAVALRADVIAADEPTSALDVTVQAEVLDLLSRLRNERGMALLLVSHDLALVSSVADRVIVMRDGAVVETGTAAAVLGAPTEPYTADLLAAVPRLEQA